jgi:hypothetical protein
MRNEKQSDGNKARKSADLNEINDYSKGFCPKMVEYLYDYIYSLGGSLYTRTDGGPSTTEWPCKKNHGGGHEPHPLIRLSLGPKARAEGANVLWDLIHEFGHVLQGPPEKKGRDPKRERDAWNRGWSYLIEKFPHLIAYESDYFSHAEECLKGGK